MIRFTPSSYIIGLWYLEMPEHLSKFGLGGNVMGAVWREPGETTWTWRTRMRQYRTLEKTAAELTRSSDEFKWWGGTCNESEEEVIAKNTVMFRVMADGAGGIHEPEFFEVRSGIERMYAIAKNGEGPHWFHVGVMPSPTGGGIAR